MNKSNLNFIFLYFYIFSITIIERIHAFVVLINPENGPIFTSFISELRTKTNKEHALMKEFWDFINGDSCFITIVEEIIFIYRHQKRGIMPLIVLQITLTPWIRFISDGSFTFTMGEEIKFSH